jgi:hypothetical protein
VDELQQVDGAVRALVGVGHHLHVALVVDLEVRVTPTADLVGLAAVLDAP